MLLAGVALVRAGAHPLRGGNAAAERSEARPSARRDARATAPEGRRRAPEYAPPAKPGDEELPGVKARGDAMNRLYGLGR